MRSAALGLGLNRWDAEDPRAFAANAATAERMGITHALLGTNPLRVHDPYVSLSLAGQQTRSMTLAPFVDNPVLRHPAVIASSISTVDRLSDGRAQLVLGAGDTAVRWLGQKPATIATMAEAVSLTRRLLAGETIETGAGAPVSLRHARQVPVWVAATGPRSLKIAGRGADGVYLRVGASAASLKAALGHVREGAVEAGRDPAEIRIGVVLHVVNDQSPSRSAAITRAIAAGFFQYTPGLFTAAGVEWTGPALEEVRGSIWPDFHHAKDLVAAGQQVSFLSQDVADAFSVSGAPTTIAASVRATIEVAKPEVVVVNPMPYPRPALDFARWFTEQVWPLIV